MWSICVSEHRRWPRMALALEVSIRFPNLDRAVTAETSNISREGLFIRMDPPKPIGTKVRLRLQLVENREIFVLEGVVVRMVPDPDEPAEPGATPGIGIFLTHTSPGWAPFVESLQHVPRGRRPDPPIIEKVRSIKNQQDR
jgi:hypothetical protein